MAKRPTFRLKAVPRDKSAPAKTIAAFFANDWGGYNMAPSLKESDYDAIFAEVAKHPTDYWFNLYTVEDPKPKADGEDWE